MDPLSFGYGGAVSLQDSNWFHRMFSQLWSLDLECPATSLAEPDLIFRCPDGQMAAHKVLLQLSCQNVAEILLQRLACPCFDDIVTLIVPDVSIKTVQKFLEFLYTGSIQLETQEELRLIQQFGCNLLGFFNLPELKNFKGPASAPRKAVQRKPKPLQILSPVSLPNLDYFENEHENEMDDDICVLDDSQASNPYDSSDGFHGSQLEDPSGMKPVMKCPECEQVFFNASTLYMHATLGHYRKQLNSMYKSDYEQNGGVCSIGGFQCKRLKTLQAYLQHLGGKHKAIHWFMKPEVLDEYAKLPTRTYMTTGKSSTIEKKVSISCIPCKGSSRNFGSISEYKQHLAIYHFRKELAQSFMAGISNNAESLCFMCPNRSDGKDGKMYKYLSLLVHLGSKHNCILEFASGELLEQLKSFNVSRQ